MILQEKTNIFRGLIELLNPILEILLFIGVVFFVIGLISWVFSAVFPRGMFPYFFNPQPRHRRRRRPQVRQEWGKTERMYLAQKQGDALIKVTGGKTDETTQKWEGNEMREEEDPLAFWRSMVDEE